MKNQLSDLKRTTLLLSCHCHRRKFHATSRRRFCSLEWSKAWNSSCKGILEIGCEQRLVRRHSHFLWAKTQLPPTSFVHPSSRELASLALSCHEGTGWFQMPQNRDRIRVSGLNVQSYSCRTIARTKYQRSHMHNLLLFGDYFLFRS